MRRSRNLPFEEAFETAGNTIVEAMEAEDLPFGTLLGVMKRGTRLAKVCQAKLADAELKIQKAGKNSAGELVLKPLSPDLSEADQ